MENEHYTAYDLEREDPKKPGVSELPENFGQSDPTEESDNSDNSEDTDSSAESGDEQADATDAARREIEAMMAEMGSEKLLAIIKGNRNEAIAQILDEVEDPSERPLSTGQAIDDTCLSIFDLAGLA